MPVSSNTLFHFTDSIEHLYNILQNDFIPHYSLETIYLENNIIKVAYPMVCFCDIPLAQIKDHLIKYGTYGIGLNKEWGIINKLNPVLYIEKNSLIKTSIDSLYSFITNQHFMEVEEASTALHTMLMYMKAYETEIRQGVEYYRYYNEREWRYIPPSADFIDEVQFNDFRQRRELNNEIREEKLKFTPDDIKYLILNNESEIDALINSIPNFKSRFNEESRMRLISRIITTDQIRNDF